MSRARRLLDRATDLPWAVHDGVILTMNPGSRTPEIEYDDDLDLIVFAVNLLPRFLDLYEEAAMVVNLDSAFTDDGTSRMPALQGAVRALSELDE